ncbi:capsular polysaccharide biosynthesis protein [Noviherbaspirillum agri]
MIGVLSRGISRIGGLSELLGESWTLLSARSAPACDRVAGWGMRPTSEKARHYAAEHRLPFVMLEDGFLRSIGLGETDDPLSMVLDDVGIYYDASTASRLESCILSPCDESRRARARELIASWRRARVSKYNHTREVDWGHVGLSDMPGHVASNVQPYVLAIDQTLGDASIRYGLAGASSFQKMLDAALAENPECKVILKVHPEVMAGRKKGHFDIAALSRNPRVLVLGQDVHPVSLLEHAKAVYVVTSQMGFEGLLWGKPVRTFGMPFYAGWGLTVDDLPVPERRCPVPLENLVHAALVDYPRYIDPETGKCCEVERVVEWMGRQRAMRERFVPDLYAIGFSRWKKPIVRDFFQGSTVQFVRNAAAVPAGASLISWGTKTIPGKLADGVSLIRLEDGFLRSVGLGAELVRPLSWVIDTEGIYYDASRPSRLETLLRTTTFDEALVGRAAALREAICASGVTKYNVGGEVWTRPATAAQVILVPGQVETDASIRLGAAEIRRNVDLLKAVRIANPDAYVLYKPHPDVRAALRRAGDGEGEAYRWCDEVLGDVPLDRLFEHVDEVHVMTSLAGFEALMRGKKVVCYGQPFYSGWGLTEDLAPHPRRQRRLLLDELVAATLILYPTYVSRTTGKFTTPERALEELVAWRQEAPARRPLLRRIVARLLRKD